MFPDFGISGRASIALAWLLLVGAAAPGSTITVELEQVRSERGLLRLCLTRSANHFPNCESDAEALKLTFDGDVRKITLPAVEPGDYALALIHDENGNGRLDTALGIPREGFGFSRNPAIGFGPPAFARVLFFADASGSHQVVQMRYIL